jgi:hypothetical protein
MKMASNLGMDQDDFQEDNTQETAQKVISAKEFMRASVDKPSWTTPEIPKPEDTQYMLVGRDEYRLMSRKSRGVDTREEKLLQLGDRISAEELFKDNEFALRQMPAYFEDDTGNIFTRETKI